MDSFYIAELAQPEGRTGAVLRLFEGIEVISRARQLKQFGNDDTVETARKLCLGYRDSLTTQRLAFVALTRKPCGEIGRFKVPVITVDDDLGPDDLIGSVLPILPLRENRHIIDGIFIEVAEKWQRRGVGRSLHRLVERLATQTGRTIFHGWSANFPGDGADAIRPKEGPYALAPSASTAFAQSLGYSLAQTERHSVQELSSKQLPSWREPDGYRFINWHDATPEHLREAIAGLESLMSTDAPLGEFEWQPETWDAQRVHDNESESLLGHRLVTTIAVHPSSGETAGYTRLVKPHDKPDVLYQWTTIVAKNHRGHGLGFALKAANLAEAKTRWPVAQRVHTWNAAENEHMWAINEALGYQVISVEGGWQKQFTPD